MVFDRFVAGAGRICVGLGLLGVGSLLAIGRPALAGAGRPVVEPAPDGLKGQTAADGGPVPAYDRPVPRFASLHVVGLSILDDRDGSPVADAEVRIRNQVDWRSHVFRTDARGRLRFEYPALHDEPTVNVEIRKGGFVPIGYGWGFDGGPRAPDTLTLRLRRGTTMGGVVVDEAGRPVGGATVLMSVTLYGKGMRADESTGYEHYREIPSRTGPDGRWRTDGVPPGVQEVQLRLIHPDFVSDGFSTLGWPRRSPKVAALLDQSDRQVLLKGVRLEGRVLDEKGRPMPGVRIGAWTLGSTSLGDDPCRPTDAEGRFEIHVSGGQKLFVTADARGYALATQEVSADPSRPAIELRLTPGQRLRGRVVDPAGHPIEGARVDILPNVRSYFESFPKRTDAEGRFEWEDAPDRPQPFHVAAQGYVASGPVWFRAGANEATITLRPAVDVRLQAVDAETGEPIPRFRVEIGKREPGTDRFGWGPRMGRSAPRKFEAVLEAENGPYHFRISADGYSPARILVPSTRTVLRKTIKLDRIGR